jgi:hypothetical protein
MIIRRMSRCLLRDTGGVLPTRSQRGKAGSATGKGAARGYIAKLGDGGEEVDINRRWPTHLDVLGVGKEDDETSAPTHP